MQSISTQGVPDRHQNEQKKALAGRSGVAARLPRLQRLPQLPRLQKKARAGRRGGCRVRARGGYSESMMPPSQRDAVTRCHVALHTSEASVIPSVAIAFLNSL